MSEYPERNPSSAGPPEASGTPASPPAVPAMPAGAVGASSTGLAPNVACGLCAVFPLVGGIVFLILEKQDALVKFWATQSVYFGVASLVASVAVAVIAAILAFVPILGWIIGGFLWLVVSLGLLVLWILGIVKAFQGRRWKMPVLGEMVEKQLGAPPAA